MRAKHSRRPAFAKVLDKTDSRSAAWPVAQKTREGKRRATSVGMTGKGKCLRAEMRREGGPSDARGKRRPRSGRQSGIVLSRIFSMDLLSVRTGGLKRMLWNLRRDWSMNYANGEQRVLTFVRYDGVAVGNGETPARRFQTKSARTMQAGRLRREKLTE